MINGLLYLKSAIIPLLRELSGLAVAPGTTPHRDIHPKFMPRNPQVPSLNHPMYHFLDFEVMGNQCTGKERKGKGSLPYRKQHV